MSINTTISYIVFIIKNLGKNIQPETILVTSCTFCIILLWCFCFFNRWQRKCKNRFCTNVLMKSFM